MGEWRKSSEILLSALNLDSYKTFDNKNKFWHWSSACSVRQGDDGGGDDCGDGSFIRFDY